MKRIFRYIFRKEIQQINKEKVIAEKEAEAIKQFLVARCMIAKKSCKTTEALILVQKFEEGISWLNEKYKNITPVEFEKIKTGLLREVRFSIVKKIK
jgi:hypothetical protein